MKLEICKRKKGKFTFMLILNNTLVEVFRSKKKSQGKLKANLR